MKMEMLPIKHKHGFLETENLGKLMEMTDIVSPTEYKRRKRNSQALVTP